MDTKSKRPDIELISDLIQSGSSVLDLGCGDGELLDSLIKGKKIRGFGIEIDEGAIYKCIAKGLSVFHGDIDTGLSEYRDKSFDYVILNESLQQIKRMDLVLNDALRVGKKVIIGIPNFAYYKARLQIFFLGKVPVTRSLPYQWYNTPNLHFLSILDFTDYCRLKNINIEKSFYITGRRRVALLPNLFGQIGIFVISKE